MPRYEFKGATPEALARALRRRPSGQVDRQEKHSADHQKEQQKGTQRNNPK